jgi:hypothetical protein
LHVSGVSVKSIEFAPGVEMLDQHTKLDDSDILIWFDIIDQDCLMQVHAINGIPGLTISTAHDARFFDWFKVDHWPFYLIHTSKFFDITAEKFDNLPTLHCFNFLISKKQINRYLLLKLVEWFNLTSFDYTWSGLGGQMDLTQLISEFDRIPDSLVSNQSQFKNHMLGPVLNIPKKFKKNPGSQVYNHAFVDKTGNPVENWNDFIGPIVSQSAVSLISESVGYHKWAVHTEKTLFAVQGLTFPIWIGGYKQAEIWADKGFDIFADVINHDYQYCESLLERCTRAFADNLHILTDLDYAREQKSLHFERLCQNRDNMTANLKSLDQAFWQRAAQDLLAVRPTELY